LCLGGVPPEGDNKNPPPPPIPCMSGCPENVRLLKILCRPVVLVQTL
jgi:hypothetical protein